MTNRRILLADDSPTIQKVVNLTFADEGIDVVCASDGDSAFQKLSEFTPDLVLADVNMPGKTGYELCEAIRQRNETQHVPVILLVGSFEPFDEERALRVGANHHLTKPFQSIRHLVNAVSELMEKGEPIDETPEPVGGAPESGDGDVSLNDNDDIDGLYRDSFVSDDELSIEPEHVGKSEDAILDDELIEMRYVDSIAENESLIETQPETPVAAGDETYAETVRADEVEPQPPEEILEGVRFESATDQEYTAVPDETEDRARDQHTDQAESSWEPAGHSFDHSFADAPPVREPEADYQFSPDVLEIQPPEPEPDSPEAGLQDAHTAETGGWPGDDGEADFISLPEAINSAASDEFNVLDLPLGEVSSRPAVTAEKSAPSNDADNTSRFSPEFIDAVAERVAEKIAQSLARHIAREVVPEVTRALTDETVPDEHES